MSTISSNPSRRQSGHYLGDGKVSHPETASDLFDAPLSLQRRQDPPGCGRQGHLGPFVEIGNHPEMKGDRRDDFFDLCPLDISFFRFGDTRIDLNRHSGVVPGTYRFGEFEVAVGDGA